MRNVIAMLFVLVVSFPVVGRASELRQTDGQRKEIELQMCQVTKCQRNLHVILKEKDGSTYDRVFDVFPGIVQEAGVLVVAGQTVFIEADVNGDNLVNLHSVDLVTNASKTIVAHLEQTQDSGMMLSLKNPFKDTLKFRIGVMPLASDDLKATSSCPVIAGGGSLKHGHIRFCRCY